MKSSRLASLLLALIGFAHAASAATLVVSANAPAGGDGSAERPLRTLRTAAEASATGDTIVLARGTAYEEGIVLKSGQTLTASAEPASAALPVIRVKEGAAITATGVTGLTIRDVAIELSANARGIVLQRASGAIAVRGGGISGTTSAHAVDVEGGSAAIALDAFAIKLANGTAISVHDTNAGSIAFGTGAAITGGDHAIALERVTGGFAITGGAIRDVRKRGISVAKASGIALRDVRFVNATSANGVSAAACGNPAPTGEHLACGAALHLHGVDGITLERVVIEDPAQVAITGDEVRDLTLNAVEIRGAGDENNEHGVQLRNLAGTLRITGAKLERNTARQLFVVQDAGEAAIEIRGSTMRGSAPPDGQQAILVRAHGEARLRVTIDDSTFLDNFSNGVQLIAEGRSSLDAVLTGNTFRKNAAAILVNAGEAAHLVYRIANNRIEQSTATAVTVHTNSAGAVSGQLDGNTISDVQCGGGCGGISVTAIGRGTASAAIVRNTVRRTDATGIVAQGGGDATLHLRIAGNSIREPLGQDMLHAILVNAGMRKPDRAVVCAELGGTGDEVNTIAGTWNGGKGIGVMRRFDLTALSIARYAGDRSNAEGLSKFVAGRNRGTAVEASIGSGVTLSDGCTIAEER